MLAVTAVASATAEFKETEKNQKGSHLFYYLCRSAVFKVVGQQNQSACAEKYRRYRNVDYISYCTLAYLLLLKRIWFVD